MRADTSDAIFESVAETRCLVGKRYRVAYAELSSDGRFRTDTSHPPPWDRSTALMTLPQAVEFARVFAEKTAGWCVDVRVVDEAFQSVETHADPAKKSPLFLGLLARFTRKPVP